MTFLNRNGFDYYKTMDYWEPVEAAGVVLGFQMDDYFFTDESYKAIQKVLDASVIAFKEKKLKSYGEKERTYEGNCYKKYCPIFLKEDEMYDKYWVTCFESIEYIKWLSNKNIIKIPSELSISTNSEGVYTWTTPPNYDSKKPFDIYDELSSMLRKDSPLWKQFRAIKLWSLDEASSLINSYEPRSSVERSIIETFEVEKLHVLLKQAYVSESFFEKKEVDRLLPNRIPAKIAAGSVGEKSKIC